MSSKGLFRLAVISLTVGLFAFAVSCGGGGGSKLSLTPGATTSSTDNAGTFAADYIPGLVIPESEISNLSPEFQKLLAHPGWQGPPTPLEPAGPAPVPEPISVEDVIDLYGNNVTAEHAPGRGVSYVFRDEPNLTDIAFGEYDPNIYDNNPPTEEPPWGSDQESNGDGDGFDDRMQNTPNPEGMRGKTYFWLGVPRENYFSSGGSIGPGEYQFEVTEVYQGFLPSSGTQGDYPWRELGYRGDQTYAAGFTDPAFWIEGPNYELYNSTADEVQPLEWPRPFKWYEVLIAPMSNVDDDGGAGYESGAGLKTFASVQWFSKDTSATSPLEYPLSDPNYPINVPYGADSAIVQLISSDNDKIQSDLIDKRKFVERADPNEEPASTGYLGTFPVFGVIFERWAFDVPFLTELPEGQLPWEGPLGWPVTPPFMVNGGARIIGDDGFQFVRFGQGFEKGYIYWDDVKGDRPDRAWVYRVKPNKETIFDATKPEDYDIDTKVLRFGTGGPYGIIALEAPKELNLAEPAIFKANVFGGPKTNNLGDDFVIWRFRDGYIGFGHYIVKAIDPPPYDYKATYVARAMAVLNPGTGIPDPNYVAFGDTDEFRVGDKIPGGGGGGGAPVLIIDNDPTDEHVNKWTADLDAIGVAYDVIPQADVISDPSIMDNYELTVFAPVKDMSVWGPRGGPWDSRIENILINSVKGGNAVICTMTQWWFRDQSDQGNVIVQDFRHVFVIGGSVGWYGPFPSYGLTGSPVASGPGGNFTALNFTYKEHHLGSNYYAGDQSPYQYTVLGSSPYGSTWWPFAASHDPAWGGGLGSGMGSEYGWALNTTPASGGTGTSAFLHNWLNWIDIKVGKNILGGGGGGGGGGEQFTPYDGPVQIGDPDYEPPRSGVYAWVINPSAAPPVTIRGGDGKTDDTMAQVSVVGSPQTIHVEVLAHGTDQDGVDEPDGDDALGFEYQSKPDWWWDDPSGPYYGQSIPRWEEWPRYTSFMYNGGIDGDITNDYDGNGNPADDLGEPFPIKVRAWLKGMYPTFADALAADPVDADGNGQGDLGLWAVSEVRVSVGGPKPVDIVDDGSVYQSSYAPDSNGEISVTLKFRLSGGVPEAEGGPYDDCDLDIDFDGINYQQEVEVFINGERPGFGPQTFTYTTDTYVPGNTYTVAGRVEDDAAPNFEDIYVWEDWVFVAKPIAIVNDGGTSSYNAIKSDLQALGKGFVELNSSQITSSTQLQQYSHVIWAPPESVNAISTTEANIIDDYVRNKGGNFFMPYSHLYYYYYLPTSFREMMGASYYFFWYDYGQFPVPDSSFVWYQGDPYPSGQQVTNVLSTGGYGTMTDVYYYYREWLSNTKPICSELYYYPWYEDGGMRDNGSVGDNKGWGAWFATSWNRVTGTNNSNVARRHLLGRILDQEDNTTF